MTPHDRPAARPTSVAVIIPAHNEERLLPACLAAIRAAAEHPGVAGTRVVVVVAADSCGDATSDVARRAGALTVGLDARNAGAARAAAARRALDVLGDDDVWIASTDADSVVPEHWLDFQLSRAAQGWEAVVGTVALDHLALESRRLAVLHQHLYEASRPPGGLTWHHPHVHGANLGLTAGSYTAAGGFPPVRVGEDHALVRSLQRAGRRILRTPDCAVTTSGRLRPRARDGFGDYLARLAAEEAV
ncbi:glycosyltransferase [Streptomyces xanthochromogenes]|uniref:glycosyltransferase n=1 Tax=Streptomyces xanthochromogenes TaxID=67384 RepID=UPI0034427612